MQTEVFATRLPANLAGELRRRAAEADRTVSQEIRRLVRRSLENEEPAGGRALATTNERRRARDVQG